MGIARRRFERRPALDGRLRSQRKFQNPTTRLRVRPAAPAGDHVSEGSLESHSGLAGASFQNGGFAPVYESAIRSSGFRGRHFTGEIVKLFGIAARIDRTQSGVCIAEWSVNRPERADSSNADRLPESDRAGSVSFPITFFATTIQSTSH